MHIRWLRGEGRCSASDGLRGRARRHGRCGERGFCAWEKHKKGRDVRKNF